MEPAVHVQGKPLPSANLVTKAAARFLGVSHRTLEDWRLRGGGPRFIKLGRRVVYTMSDLLEFVDGCRRSNTGQEAKN